MAISKPILVLPSDELLIKLRSKVPIDCNRGPKGQMTLIFANCIDFALLAKKSTAPIFDPKFRRKVGFGYLQNQLSNFSV